MTYKRNYKYVPFSRLLGETFKEIRATDSKVVFITDDREFTLEHQQSCCEQVYLEDVEGSWNDLIGNPILVAEENSNGEYTEHGHETWTFYKIATIKGYVDMRWYGSSNGYYSESVDLIESWNEYE